MLTCSFPPGTARCQQVTSPLTGGRIPKCGGRLRRDGTRGLFVLGHNSSALGGCVQCWMWHGMSRRACADDGASAFRSPLTSSPVLTSRRPLPVESVEELGTRGGATKSEPREFSSEKFSGAITSESLSIEGVLGVTRVFQQNRPEAEDAGQQPRAGSVSTTPRSTRARFHEDRWRRDSE